MITNVGLQVDPIKAFYKAFSNIEAESDVHSSIFREVPRYEARFGLWVKPSLPAITCLKLTIETLEQGLKYVQS